MFSLFRRRKAEPEIVIAPVLQPREMTEEDRLMLRAAAQMEIQTSLGLRDRLITEIAASLRWIQASLLVVNGGAAVAVLQGDAMPPHARVWSLAAFVLGIVLSLVSAYVSVLVSQDMPRKITELIGYWITVTVDLLRSEEIERDWAEYGRAITRRTWLSRALGWGSLLAFVVGSLAAGWQLISA